MYYKKTQNKQRPLYRPVNVRGNVNDVEYIHYPNSNSIKSLNYIVKCKTPFCFTVYHLYFKLVIQMMRFYQVKLVLSC